MFNNKKSSSTSAKFTNIINTKSHLSPIERLYPDAFETVKDDFNLSDNQITKLKQIDYKDLVNYYDFASELVNEMKTESELAVFYGLLLYLNQDSHTEVEKFKRRKEVSEN